jgi:ribosomal-protein-alanine N-acetyltransferase
VTAATAAIRIRPATPDDIDTIVVLELEVFSARAWSPRSVEEEFTGLGDNRLIWLAEATSGDGGLRPVGYAAGRYVHDVADLQRVAVLPSMRRRGIGARLTDQVVSAARSRSCERVLLEVAADNASAIALYVAMDFREIDRRPRYYDGDVDAVVMHRELTDGVSPGG